MRALLRPCLTGFAPVPFPASSVCILRFLFPFYRTECSERSCYCMCLMSHMEAVRLQQCLGNVMPADRLSSFPSYYHIAFSAISSRPSKQFTCMPGDVSASPAPGVQPSSLLGQEGFGSAIGAHWDLGDALQSLFCGHATCKGLWHYLQPLRLAIFLSMVLSEVSSPCWQLFNSFSSKRHSGHFFILCAFLLLFWKSSSPSAPH